MRQEDLAEVNRRLNEHDKKLEEVLNQVRTLTAAFVDMTQINKDLRDNAKTAIDTSKEVRDLFDSIKRTIKFFAAIGSFIKWLAMVASAILVIWGAWQAVKSGQIPSIPHNPQ